jgi:hypothetical protein
VNVICVKAKPHYDYRYVNRLYRAVQKHLPVKHRFVCLTDDAAGVICNTKGLPPNVGGWWAKLAMFREGVFDGPCIYFDLDTLICDDISFLAEFTGDFAILRDFYRPQGYGSGVMVWNAPHPHIWGDWIIKGKPLHPLGDQGWMEKKVKNAVLLQDLYPGAIKSYKADDLADGPKSAAIVCFHGFPKPHDFAPNHWVASAWMDEQRIAA